MKTRDFERFFNKNNNQKNGKNNDAKGVSMNQNRMPQRTHTITQNKGK